MIIKTKGRKKTGIFKSCCECGKLFYVKKCHIDYLFQCSRKCQGLWNSKNKIGKKSNNWKGGFLKNKDGYIYQLSSNHPNKNSLGYVYKHRLIMEKHLGRFLTSEEVVHHIDKNPSNNSIKNLMLFPNNGEHRKYHGK